MLFAIVLLPTLALGVLGTPIINRGAMGEEAHAGQSTVAGMDQKLAAEPDTHGVWNIETRADQNGTIWSVEKRAPVTAEPKQLKRANYATPQRWRPDA
ncbi:MAG: hypothetical protein ASARMPRED_005580 [Alectoria sarmentosa]|nr:MAG: hypothetical protein ASARMPRED_005580 [Alectoria sarmentosa]